MQLYNFGLIRRYQIFFLSTNGNLNINNKVCIGNDEDTTITILHTESINRQSKSLEQMYGVFFLSARF